MLFGACKHCENNLKLVRGKQNLFPCHDYARTYKGSQHLFHSSYATKNIIDLIITIDYVSTS